MKYSKMKRERSANFSAVEVTTLVSIINEYKDILECKRTDGTIWREKDIAWDKITQSFNSHFDNPRAKKTLRAKYDDLKKKIRKKGSNDTTELYKMHGGPVNLRQLTMTKEDIDALTSKRIDGETTVSSVWDSERVPSKRLREEISTVGIVKVDRDDDESCAEMDSAHEDYSNVEYIESAIIPEVDMSEAPDVQVRATREREMEKRDERRKEELHQIRLKILQRELEINDARLQAANLEVEIKLLRKQVQEANFKKLTE